MPHLFKLKQILSDRFTVEGLPYVRDVEIRNTGELWQMNYTDQLALHAMTQFGELETLLAQLGAKHRCLLAHPDHKALEEAVNVRILFRWFVDNFSSEGVIPARPIVVRYGRGDFSLEADTWRLTEMADLEKIRAEIPRLRRQFEAVRRDQTGIGYAILKKEEDVRAGHCYQVQRLNVLKNCHEKLMLAGSELARYYMEQLVLDAIAKLDKSLFYAITKVANHLLSPSERWATNVFPSFKKRLDELHLKSRRGFFSNGLTVEERKELETTTAYFERASAIVSSIDYSIFVSERFLSPASEALIDDLKLERGDFVAELLGYNGIIKDSLIYGLIKEITNIWVENGFEYPKAPERYLLQYYNSLKNFQLHDVTLLHSHFVENDVVLPPGQMMCFFAKKRIDFDLVHHLAPTEHFFEVATVLILKAYKANYLETLPDGLREHLERLYKEDPHFLAKIVERFNAFERKQFHFDDLKLQEGLEHLARSVAKVELMAEAKMAAKEGERPPSPEADDGGHEFAYAGP